MSHQTGTKRAEEQKSIVEAQQKQVEAQKQVKAHPYTPTPYILRNH